MFCLFSDIPKVSYLITLSWNVNSFYSRIRASNDHLLDLFLKAGVAKVVQNMSLTLRRDYFNHALRQVANFV